MEEQIKEIKKEVLGAIQKCQDLEELAAIRIRYLGRQGKITLIIRGLKNLPSQQRPKIGYLANLIKKEIENKIAQKLEDLKVKRKEEITKEKIDITASPPSPYSYGHFHPLTQVLEIMIDIFNRLGFKVVEGPEIENDWYCFEALNMPPEHPARDMQDSFYITKDILPRTHTSSVQVRYLEKHKPPVRIIVPGRVYRRESDVTHTVMFHQLEGLLVDEQTTFADLKGVLTTFAQAFFGQKRKVRFRPSFFPYTEPSAEIDISCGVCGGKGCRSCKYSGWLEVLGAGMVHPNVFKSSGLDSKKYQGFAFGAGIERLAMLKYNIDDIRLFFDNDLRFLEQF